MADTVFSAGGHTRNRRGYHLAVYFSAVKIWVSKLTHCNVRAATGGLDRLPPNGHTVASSHVHLGRIGLQHGAFPSRA